MIRISVATYCFVPTFRKAKFCGVPSGAIVIVGCAVGKTRLLNADVGVYICVAICRRSVFML
jgi:hypothetical protein